MLKQGLNSVDVIGILKEVDLEEKADKNGNEYVKGVITFLVSQEINGVYDDDEIPVNVFSYKLIRNGDKRGQINPSYQSIMDLKDSYQSIASLGGDQKAVNMADRYCCRNARLEINEFIGGDGRTVSYPRISGSFFNKISGAFNPEASFKQEIVIKRMEPEVKDDAETGRLKIEGIAIQWGGRPDIITYYVGNRQAVEYFNDHWHPEDTVKIEGSIRWAATTEEAEIEDDSVVSFGAPKKRTINRTVKEFLITGGSEEPYSEGTAYDIDEVVRALQKKKDDLENSKKNSSSSTTTTRSRGF